MEAAAYTRAVDWVITTPAVPVQGLRGNRKM